MQHIIPLFPEIYAQQLRHLEPACPEEIRLSSHAPIRVRSRTGEKALWPKTGPSQLEQIRQAACQHSVYAYAETLRNGYITIEGGHRIGICGCGVMRDNQIITMHTPSSILIRIARAVPGCAAPLAEQVYGSSLIIGPPGSGKTTLLRDLIRLLSNERHCQIGIVDERGEIAACRNGVPQLDVGLRTDILVNIPKSIGITMLTRTMAPQWVAVDEITSSEDIKAIEYASFCGVHLLATAHAFSPEDLSARPLYRKLIEQHIFKTIVTMQMDKTYQIGEAAL